MTIIILSEEQQLSVFKYRQKLVSVLQKKSKQLEKFSAKKIFYTKYGFGSVYFTCAWVRWYLLPISLTTNFPFDIELRTNIDVMQAMCAYMVYMFQSVDIASHIWH